MFTGIVTHRATLLRTEETASGRRLALRSEPRLASGSLGTSVAVDGVCLTVAASEGDVLSFDVVPETLRRTTLGRRRPGDRLNLEPALRFGDEMGGHWVQGHVEGTGEVMACERRGEDVHVTVRVGPALRSGVIPKGSVALDGVSLTVGEVWQEPEDLATGSGRFRVYLIPHTLAVTSLGEARPGSLVNVEPDVLGRLVEHHVRRILGREGPPAPAEDPPGGGGPGGG